MTMALTRAHWHHAYRSSVPKPLISPKVLIAQWACDQNGIPRCRWESISVEVDDAGAADSMPAISSLDLVR